MRSWIQVFACLLLAVPATADAPPVINITSPANGSSVTRSTTRLTATCTDDDARGCKSFALEGMPSPIQSADGKTIDVVLRLTDSVQFHFRAEDHGGNVVYETREVHLENSAQMRLVASAPGEVADFDGGRILFRTNDAALGIYDIASRTAEVIPDTFNLGAGAYLIPAGAIWNNGWDTTSRLQELRNGVVTTVVEGGAASLQRAGRYVLFGFRNSTIRRDIVDGTQTTFDLSPGRLWLAPNGSFLYTTNGPLYLFDGTSTKLLHEYYGVDSAASDGTEAIFHHWGHIYLFNGTTTTVLSYDGPAYASMAMNNGWAVFQAEESPSGWDTIMRRKPGALTAEPAVPFLGTGAQNVLHYGLSPNGEFVYERWMSPNDRHLYMAGQAYDSDEVVVSRSGIAFSSVTHSIRFLDGRLYVLAGDAVLQYEPPKGEMSGDHRSDVLWRNTSSGQLELWPMYGAHPDLYPHLPAVGSPWTSQAGDFNGDGVTDLLWRNPDTGAASIWFVNLRVIGGVNLPNLPAGWESYPGDFNGDGFDDLLLRDTATGQVSMWMLRHGRIIDGGDLPSLPVPWKIHPGDFNADGRTDVMLQNPSTADNTIWFLRGRFIIGGQPLPRVGAPWEAFIGSYDGDAHADILWRNASTGQISIWRMVDGLIMSGGDLPQAAAAAHLYRGDFNGDGTTDLLWHAPGAAAMTLMLMNGTSVWSTHELTRTAGFEVMNLGQ